MKQTYRLTENELHSIISECITEAIEDEGFLNQVGQGVRSFFGKGEGSDKSKEGRTTISQDWGGRTYYFGQRFKAAKTGYKEQGYIDDLDDIIKPLDNLVKSGKISQDMTVKDILAHSRRLRGGAVGRISAANNKIYQ